MNATPRFAWLNGELLPFESARLPLSDRGLLLGDSLFETLAVAHGRPFALQAHVERLARGMTFCRFQEAPDPALLADAAQAVVMAEVAAGAPPHGALRITVTRGPGRRGYSPGAAGPSNAFVVFHAGPEPCTPHPGWTLRTSSFRLPHGDPMAPFKHGSRMLHVLARAEAEAHGSDEALLLNTRGEPAECASGNLLWFEGDVLVHAASDSGALAGVTQDIVVGLAQRHGLQTMPARPHVGIRDALTLCGGIVVLSTLGIVPVLALDGSTCRQRMEARLLADDLRARVLKECAASGSWSPVGSRG
ncbi:MAG: hypothetical protein RL153_50 [Verrucomicrobiota bacterium]